MKYRYIPVVLSVLSVLMTGCDSSTEEGVLLRTEEDDALVVGCLTRGGEEEWFAVGDTVRMDVTGRYAVSDAFSVFTAGGWMTVATGAVDDGADSVRVSVTFPYRSVYDSAALYDADGLLADVCWGRTVTTGRRVDVALSHCFARVTVTVDDALRDALRSIGLCVPGRVKVFRPADGSFSFDGDEEVTGVVRADGAADYSFTVPSGEVMRLKLVGSTRSGGWFENTLPLQCFAAGHEYAFALGETAAATGIHSTGEWLDFVGLYNSSRDEAMAKYGLATTEGVVFRILNDLDFTGVKLTDFTALGTTACPFSDILDGCNHTISNLTLPDNAHGLLREGGSTSILRNLNLVAVSQKVTLNAASVNSEGEFGLLVGVMNGKIDHCTLTDCTIAASKQQHMIGMFAGKLRGLLVNSALQNCWIENGRYTGGVGTLPHGNIVNCLFREVTVTGCKYGGVISGVCQGTEETPVGVRNCWIYQPTFVGYEYTTIGCVTGFIKCTDVVNCFYPDTSTKEAYGHVVQAPAAATLYLYDEASGRVYADGELTATPAVTLLNGWVEAQGEAYEGAYLSRWTSQSDASSVAFK